MKENIVVPEPDMTKPSLSIDQFGNMILYLPLAKTNDIICRGMIDKAHDEIIMWYARADQKQREINILGAKTGYQRFKDKIMGTH